MTPSVHESADPVSIVPLRPGPLFEVTLRRKDGSVVVLGSQISRLEADSVAKRFRDGLHRDEAWALRAIDVSAGELRS